eukprot:929205-Pyramimonas_sp.AAC.1
MVWRTLGGAIMRILDTDREHLFDSEIQVLDHDWWMRAASHAYGKGAEQRVDLTLLTRDSSQLSTTQVYDKT